MSKSKGDGGLGQVQLRAAHIMLIRESQRHCQESVLYVQYTQVSTVVAGKFDQSVQRLACKENGVQDERKSERMRERFKIESNLRKKAGNTPNR